MYVLDQLGRLLEQVPELAQQMRGYGRASRGSPVRREQIGASAALEPLVEEARTAATLRMIVAEEHIGVIGGLVRNERVVFSIYSRLGTYTYKLLSAFSHGTLYALHILLSRAPDAEVDELGTVTGVAGTDFQQEVHVLDMTLLPFMRATHRMMIYNGWSDETYARHIVNIADELGRCRSLEMPDDSTG